MKTLSPLTFKRCLCEKRQSQSVNKVKWKNPTLSSFIASFESVMKRSINGMCSQFCPVPPRGFFQFLRIFFEQQVVWGPRGLPGMSIEFQKNCILLQECLNQYLFGVIFGANVAKILTYMHFGQNFELICLWGLAASVPACRMDWLWRHNAQS